MAELKEEDLKIHTNVLRKVGTDTGTDGKEFTIWEYIIFPQLGIINYDTLEESIIVGDLFNFARPEEIHLLKEMKVHDLVKIIVTKDTTDYLEKFKGPQGLYDCMEGSVVHMVNQVVYTDDIEYPFVYMYELG